VPLIKFVRGCSRCDVHSREMRSDRGLLFSAMLDRVIRDSDDPQKGDRVKRRESAQPRDSGSR
jgi:hypothetical protein